MLFPSAIYCIACGSMIDKSRPYALCDNCREKFHWASGKTCEKCGKPLQENYLHDRCMDCRQTAHLFHKGYACVQYGLRERGLLLSFKYAGKAYIGEKLAEIMADRIAPEGIRPDLVIPVPLHPARKKKRGYNQAGILAKHLARRLGVPFSEKLLLRTGKTFAMSKLTPGERRRNMENAFSIAPGRASRLSGKNILLVDDIFTTGSTADACCAALLSAGAAEVNLFCFAAGANFIQSKVE